MIGYFDNAATTYKKPDGMYEYMSSYMLSYGANVGRGSYESAIKSGQLVQETRTNILKLMNASDNKAVVFCPSATIALNTIINGLSICDGDTVYISHFEHNAILRPLYHLQEKIKFTIKFLPMSAFNKFEFDIQKIEECFSNDKPKLVIVSHVSNVFGIIAPVDIIATLAHKNNAIVLVDGAQACGLLSCNLSFIDYYVFAGHKTLLGPTGIGGFICDKSTNLNPLIFGGTGMDSINHQMPKTIPERFEPGTINLLSIVGLHFSTNWISNNKKFILDAEKDNLKKLYDLLSNYDFINIISPNNNISSIISCSIQGYTSDEFGNILSERKISIRTGLHCAPLAHEYMGTSPEGLARFSVSPFTNNSDFDFLTQVLDQLSYEL